MHFYLNINLQTQTHTHIFDSREESQNQKVDKWGVTIKLRPRDAFGCFCACQGAFVSFPAWMWAFFLGEAVGTHWVRSVSSYQCHYHRQYCYCKNYFYQNITSPLFSLFSWPYLDTAILSSLVIDLSTYRWRWMEWDTATIMRHVLRTIKALVTCFWDTSSYTNEYIRLSSWVKSRWKLLLPGLCHVSAFWVSSVCAVLIGGSWWQADRLVMIINWQLSCSDGMHRR